MKKGLITTLIVSTILLIFAVNIGYAYNSIVVVNSDISGDYCSIQCYVNESPVNGISIVQGYSEDSTPLFNLSFTSSSGTQETLSLHYHHTKGTDLILSISFVVSGLNAGSQTIVCYEGANVVGSTLLSGIGEKSGTISGIVLGFENKKIDDKIDYRFEIKGINSVEGISVQMSLSVHPLEVSS